MNIYNKKLHKNQSNLLPPRTLNCKNIFLGNCVNIIELVFEGFLETNYCNKNLLQYSFPFPERYSFFIFFINLGYLFLIDFVTNIYRFR